MEDRSLILVVDDDPTVRLITTGTLRAAGYAVEEAADGAAGVARFTELRPALVLLDVMMPVMDGFEACRKMRSCSDIARTPILMLTTLDDRESIERSFDVGATDFITKPINAALLGQRVRYALRARSLAVALSRSQERLADTQRIAKVAYWEYDPKRNRLRWDAMPGTPVVGEHPEGISLERFVSLVHGDDRAKVLESIGESLDSGAPYSAEHRIVLDDGAVLQFFSRGEVVAAADGSPSHIAGSFQDITELRRLEQEVEFLSKYDSLTGLPNRSLLRELLSAALDEARRDGGKVLMLNLDLDNFKIVNDTLGQEQGDQLLRRVARRLDNHQGGKMILSRLGGDEFAAVVPGVAGAEHAGEVAQDVLDLFRKPFASAGRELFLTTSVGVAVFPADGEDAAALIKNADAALYQAKSAGRNTYRYFTPELNRRADERLSFETDLRRAVDNGQLSLAYQPLLELSTGKVVGVEALLRWHHPERGSVSPAEFVPVLEEQGLISAVGEWVLRQACEQGMQWSNEMRGDLRVSINVSAHQLVGGELVDAVGQILAASGLDSSRLELEITESVIMRDARAALSTLEELKELGVRLAIDDFGTGYSSLAYLQRLPVDVLKIDRSFVSNMVQNVGDALIVRSTIDLAHNFGLEVVAEGVEDQEVIALLKELACDVAQGFEIARPTEPETLAAWLSTRSEELH